MDPVKPITAAALAALLLSSPGSGQAGTQNALSGARSALASVDGAGQPVGVEVYVQAWDPRAPDNDVPRTALNEPAGVSGPMNAAWDAARKILSDPKNPNSVPALLSRGGLIAHGINLYSITFTTHPLSAITIQAGGGPAAVQADAFTIHWIIPGTRLDFRSTTPNLVSGIGVTGDLDPKLSVQLDLDITLGFAVSDRPGQPALQVTQTVVHVTNPQVDSGNFSGDVIKAITNFCSELVYGRNLNTLIAYVLGDKNIAADPQHGGFDFGGVQGIDVKSIANEHLQTVNAQIARSAVGDYLRVGLWAKHGNGAQMLALLFAPKTMPLPPQSGTLSGNVIFDKGIAAAQLPANCNSVIGKDGVDVEVQTGPRKVLDVDPFSYGVKPMLRLANVTFGGGPVMNHQCAFTLSGLVTLWPNNVSFPAPAVSSHGSFGHIGHYLQLRPDGWTSPVTLTAALPNHDLLAGGSLAYNPGAGAQRNPGAMKLGVVNQGDPAYNPAAAPSAWGARQSVGASAVAPATTSAWGARQSAGAAAVAPATTNAWGAPAAATDSSSAHSTLPAAGSPVAGASVAGSRLQKSLTTGAKATQGAAPSGVEQVGQGQQ